MLKNDADEFNIRMIQSTQQKFNNSNLQYLKINFSKSLHRIVLAWIEIPTGVFLSKSVRWTGIIKNYFFYLIN